MGSLLFTLGIFLAILGPITGVLRVWDEFGFILSPAGSYTTACGLFLCLTGLYLCRWRLSISPQGVLYSLCFLLATDWITNPYSLLRGPEIRGEILFGAFLAFLVHRSRLLPKTLFAVSIASSLLLAWCFFDVSHGRFLYSDDHSVVLYRLSLLKENFPFIPFYNPIWNAGIDARDFFATGTLNIFAIGAPLLYLFNPQDVYNIIIATILFILLPLSTYTAAKIDEQKGPIPAIAAILSLSASLLWYRWGLKYGSMGFVTATTLIPFNLIAAKRIVFQEQLSKRTLGIFIITATLMLFWSLSGVVFLPLIGYAFFNLRSLLRDSRVRKVLCWLLALNLPWIFLFLSVSKVTNFLSAQGASSHVEASKDAENTSGYSATSVKGNKKSISIKQLLKTAREESGPVHPLILVLTLPGILCLRRSSKIMLGATLSWLLFLGFMLSPLKPQLELDRMFIIATLLGVLPASQYVWHIMEAPCRSVAYKAARFIALGCLFAGIFSTSAIVYIRTPEIFTFSDDVFYSLGSDIKKHAGDGRTVFLGFVLHELNFGHLAPLMFEAQKPLVSSTPYHNVWWYTNLIPKEYMLQGEVGIESYLNNMNASLVIAHERQWRDYCSSKPDRYEFVARHGVFNIFKRRTFPDSYLLEGSGRLVSQNSSSMTFEIQSTDAVIKFNYLPFLQSSNCTLAPHPLPGEITFTRLSNCTPNSTVTISAKTGFKRFF